METNLKELIEQSHDPKENQRNVDDIINMVTAENLCSCRDPVNMAFQVNCALRRLAEGYTENTTLLNRLADQTEDFSVQLVDQISANEELVIRDEPDEADRYASLLTPMTDDAIKYSQKKFISNPLMYKRLKIRWKQGLPEVLKRRSLLLWLMVFIETALTPFLLPLLGWAFYRDQKKCRRRLTKAKIERQRPICRNLAVPAGNPGVIEEFVYQYYCYSTCPFVLFLKEKFSEWLFIVLHCIVCVSPSSVEPTVEEYLILILFCGMTLNEYQQYKKSPVKYFKDMWNYLDVIIEIIYILTVILRITTIARGGVPYNNRLLEISNYLYGINTLLMVLRVSSILELNQVAGPLQLALNRMLGDLLIILSQFFFVIVGFSLAITKSYNAERSYLRPHSNHSGTRVGKSVGFVRTCELLIWSALEKTELKEWKSVTKNTTVFVNVLFCIFLIVTVIMLVNVLVALLTKTYDNITNNAEVEWKFSRAVCETQYRGMHAVAVPFNLLTMPATILCLRGKKDARKQEAHYRRKEYKKYYQECLFPVLTKRYKKKYGGSFPLSVEEKIDLIMERLQQLKIPTSIENTLVNKVRNIFY
ncbi:unnamed protein product [Porites lobata]|uniref:Ion transport domain-containing protein n=1 Tax=Porites lobata TaxID=104759 RepID=A0ABN8QN92_9CNID|nr:unnamed protein product [Porites lobata]